jgi:hypothetical protein
VRWLDSTEQDIQIIGIGLEEHSWGSHGLNLAVVPEEKEVYKIEITVLALTQGCTNPGYHLAQVTTFCSVVPNILGSSVWNLLHITGDE